MLKRTAYDMLLSWKQESAGKALLVDGARQIGKTFLNRLPWQAVTAIHAQAQSNAPRSLE